MAHKAKSENIDVKGTVMNYLHHWWWFVISVGLCGVLGYLYLRSKNPEYQIRANVQVVTDDTGAMTSMSGLSDLFGSTARVDDEVYVVNSHTVLRDVARQLGLNVEHVVKTGFLKKHIAYPEFPVTVTAPAGLADTLMTTLKFDATITANRVASVKVTSATKETLAEIEGQPLPLEIKTSYGTYTLTATDHFPKGKEVETIIYFSGYDVAAEDLAENITSEVAGKRSNVIELYLKTTNTVEGQDILNTVIECYNRRGIENMNRQGLQTEAFLDERINLISDELIRTEERIQSYKQGKGIVDVASEASYNMQMRGTAERALVNAETRSEIIKMTRDFLRQPENAYELIPASTDIPAVATAAEAYNTLILERMDLAQNARGNNQALRQMDAQIDAMRASINASLERAYETSLVSINDARKEAAKAMSNLGNIPAQEREYLTLKRQQEVKQQLYLFLLQRREETAMMIANAIPKGRIIDEAYSLSEPLGMGKKMLLAIICLLGMCIPPVILYVKKLMRNKFSSRKEVESMTDVPILGEICRDKSGRSLVVSAHDTSSTTELFRLMRASLLFMLNDINDKVVLVTSTRSGEGKSFVSVNLAATLSLLGKKVLLVGMDIRNPQLAASLGLSNSRGITNYLATSGMNIDELIHPVEGMDNMDVIVAGPVPPNPGELLASKAVDDLFVQLRARYDYIVVDSAPVGMVSDTFNLDRISDATVYVCRVNYTSLQDVDFLNTVFTEKRLRKMSLVVNGTNSSSRYGYGYGYANTQKSKK